MKVEIADVQLQPNNQYIFNIIYQFYINDEEGCLQLKAQFNLQQTLIKVHAHVEIKSAKDKNYDCTDNFFDKNLDICKLNQKTMNGPITSIIYKSLVENINFPLKCPYKSGFYQFSNGSFILPKTPFKLWEGFYCYELTMFGRTIKSKRSEEIFKFKANFKMQI